MGYQISKICIPLISQLLDQKQLKSTDIQAIGFHGPTIRHQPMILEIWISPMVVKVLH